MIEDIFKKIFEILHQFYSTKLYPAFISLLKLLVNNKDALWILIGVFVVLLVVRSKVKLHRTLPKVIDPISASLAILIAIVAFFRFGPTVSDYLKKNSVPSESSTTKTSQPASQNQGTSKTNQKTTTPQTTKQLYYSVSCYNCYADGCSRNGYNYGGYSAEYYSYYRNICQNCQCADFKSQSFWR